MSEGDTTNSTERIPLTKEIADFIDAEIRRSGISPACFVRDHAKDSNLSAHKIWKWRRHKSKTILKSDLDEFMASWGAFPDVAPRIELTSKHVGMISKVAGFGLLIFGIFLLFRTGGNPFN